MLKDYKATINVSIQANNDTDAKTLLKRVVEIIIEAEFDNLDMSRDSLLSANDLMVENSTYSRSEKLVENPESLSEYVENCKEVKTTRRYTRDKNGFVNTTEY